MSGTTDRFMTIKVFCGDPLDDCELFDSTELSETAVILSKWLSQLLNKTINPDLTESLSDGVVLCELFKLLFPKSNLKFYKMSFNNEKRKRYNIYTFSQNCVLLGIPACTTLDYTLFACKQMDKIIMCIFRFLITLLSYHFMDKLNLTQELLLKLQIYTLYYGFVLNVDNDISTVCDESNDSDNQYKDYTGYLKSNSSKVKKFYDNYYNNSLLNNKNHSSHTKKWYAFDCCSRDYYS